MIRELDKATLQRLYLKEKKSVRDIAKISRCSPTKVRYRCIKYGIKLRVSTWNRRINLKKSDLVKLYVKEGKSPKEVAEILSCSSMTVIKRCKEYGIPLRSQKIEGITKPLLHKLYIKEGKTTREIAKKLGCSSNLVRISCHEFGIPLRNPGPKKIQINELVLKKLFVKEGKSIAEIAKTFSCSYGIILHRIKRLGLKKREGR